MAAVGTQWELSTFWVRTRWWCVCQLVPHRQKSVFADNSPSDPLKNCPLVPNKAPALPVPPGVGFGMTNSALMSFTCTGWIDGWVTSSHSHHYDSEFRAFWAVLICSDGFLCLLQFSAGPPTRCSGFSLPLSKDLLPRSPFSRVQNICAASSCALIFRMLNAVPMWTLQTPYLFSASSYKREICLSVGRCKVLQTCNFQILLTQHLRAGLRTGTAKIWSCFCSSVEIWSFTSLQQLVPSRSRKLTACWLLAYQLEAELKGNLTAQRGFYKIFTVF